MHNEIELIPAVMQPISNARMVEDPSATRVVRRRNDRLIADHFVAGSVAFHTRRYVHGFGYTVDFAERVTATADRVWLTCDR